MGSKAAAKPAVQPAHGYIWQSRAHGQWTPDGQVKVANVAEHNRAVELQELEVWMAGPERWQGYIDAWEANSQWSAKATGSDRWLHQDRSAAGHRRLYLAYPAVTLKTWLGTGLGRGRITGISTNNLGAMVTRIRVQGTNGRTYIGQHGEMDFCRVRAIKGRAA